MASVPARTRRRHVSLALCLTLLITGCTQTKGFVKDEGYQRPSGPVKVLVMEPDVEVSQLTAGGMMEPNAQWTQQAKAQIEKALASVLAEYKTEMAEVFARRAIEKALEGI